MTKLEAKYFDEYKRLNRVCSDMFGDSNGVSRYISRMEELFETGRKTVPIWESDYRTLNRLRYVRNKIAHDDDSSSCTESDFNSLEEFYDRLLKGRDALSCYTRLQAHGPTEKQSPQGKSNKSSSGFLAAILLVSVAFFIIYLLAKYYGF